MTGDNRIAIIGMGCRMPGAADPDGLWQVLAQGRDVLADLTADELAAAGLAPGEIADPHYVRRAALLDGIDRFDPAFFGLSPREAELLDPQHRLFFECAWEAMAAAGRAPQRGSNQGAVGVFAGCSISSYLLFNLLPRLKADASAATLLAMIGNDKDYLASHTSYLFGLGGPSVGIQTACSTSLVAVHMACQSLLSGECDMALAGGATIRVPHRVGYRFEPGSILSPTGYCRSFDAAADGTVFGSGVGVVLLRRLDDALAAGDPVAAVILGSAVNNDSDRKAGFTAPSVDGQAAVIAEALAVAGVEPETIGYVEAHGTGTPIGDPIEMRALNQVFEPERLGARRIVLGSAKAAIGHLEAASGVAGLMAAVQALRHATLPPLANFVRPNPALNLDRSAFRIAGASEPWARNGVARRAGVSSFGIGGTNAHVVLEEAPATGARPAVPSPFRRQSYWLQPAADRLPGRAIDTALADRLYEIRLGAAEPAWLAEHVVDGAAVLPAAAYAALAVTAGCPALGPFAIRALLAVPPGGVALQTAVGRDGSVAIHARGPAGWEERATFAAAAAPERRALDLGQLRLRCPAPVDAAAFYRRMAANGIALGPSFRRLADIAAGSGEAVARLLPLGLDADAELVTTLDAMFQLLGVTLDGAAHLPTGCDGLMIDPTALGGDLWLHAGLRPRQGDAVIGDLALLRPDGQVVAAVAGLVCQPRRSEIDVGDMLYEPVWQPAEPPAPPVVPPPTGDLSVYAEYLPRIDALAGRYVARAFLALGSRFVPGERLVPPDVAPGLRRLVPRLMAMLRQDGAIDDGDRVLRLPETETDLLLAGIQADFPAQRRETGMLARCGAALGEVLAGRADPLALLFAETDDGARAVYAEAGIAAALGEMVAGALRDGPDALRVVEIGGGTGGTTRHALPALGDRVGRYLFTDVSPAFLAAAAAEFGVTSALLDIERDPMAQGLATAGADLVLAANVLHATRDLAAAVGHAAALLAPGGRLVLVEGLTPSRWLDLTFGLTPGWWHGTDRDLRPDYPLLDAAGWRRLLDRDFDDVVVATPGPGRLGEQAVIVARRRGGVALTIVDAALDAADPAAAVLAALQAMSDADLLVATRGAQRVDAFDLSDPAQAAVLGLVRAAALERPDSRLRLVDLDPLDPDPAATLAREAAIPDDEREVAWRAGRRQALRLARLAPAGLPDAFRLGQDAPGALDTVAPQPMPVPQPGPGEVVIRIEAAGVNFKDVLGALGVVGAMPLGGECAGRVVATGPGAGLAVGDAVVAVAGGSLASHVVVPGLRVARLPAGLTAVQAAAIPVAGFTAWHALRELAPPQPGQRVLIHSATGAVGQFAAGLARRAGAEVVVTAGSPARRAWLRGQGFDQVLDSRDPVLATGPVDIVLNSLGGAMIPAGLKLLRPGGRFVELGRAGIWSAAQVAAEAPQVDYRVVALDQVDDAEGGRLLRAALDAVATAEMDLPPLTVIPFDQAAAALRLMSRAGHLGKIVLTRPSAFAFRPDRSYLITGGFGGLGLAVAGWAVAGGARRLVLAGRRPPDAAAEAEIDRLRATGADIRAEQVDVAQREAVAALLAGIEGLAGVFHAAGTLDDGPLAEMTPARLAAVMGAKIAAAGHLDALTGPLDAFVLFSSAAGLLGSPGQANHAAANAALDALAERRRGRGLNAVSIAWGAWSGIGAAAKRDVAGRLAQAGMGTIAPAAGLAALARAIDADRARVAVLPIDWPAMTRHFDGVLPPLLRSVAPVVQRSPISAPIAPAVAPSTLRPAELADRIEAAARALLSATGPVRHDRPLQELGLDSLLSVELRNRLSALAGRPLPATLLFNYPTIAALADHLGGLMFPDRAQPIAAVAAADDDFAALLSDLEGRHLS